MTKKSLKITDASGADKGEFELKPEWLEMEKGEQAVHEVVVAHLAAARAGTASTKTRAEVKASKSKPYRQKGRGTARAGSVTSPIWRGGGIAFGPKPRSFAKRVNKKTRTLALKRAFSERVAENAVKVVEDLKLEAHKTKSFVAAMDKLGLKDEKLLVVVKDYDQNILRASGNVKDTLVIKAASVNVYQLLMKNKILFTKEALEEFSGRLAK
jgi:large subunit ribosomal protein L4